MLYRLFHGFRFSHVLSRTLITERFILFRLGYRLVRKLNFSRTVRVNGRKVTVPVQNGMGLMNFVFTYEAWMDAVLPKLLRNADDVFIDVGANIGQTMLKVKSRFPHVRYHGIEPNPNCTEYLEAVNRGPLMVSVRSSARSGRI